MRLQAETPSGMRETVFYRATHVIGECRTVHRLKREMPKGQVLEALRLRLWLDLRIYELELVSAE